MQTASLVGSDTSSLSLMPNIVQQTFGAWGHVGNSQEKLAPTERRVEMCGKWLMRKIVEFGLILTFPRFGRTEMQVGSKNCVFEAKRTFLSALNLNRGHECRFLGQQPVPNRSKTKNQGCAAALHEIALKRAGKN